MHAVLAAALRCCAPCALRTHACKSRKQFPARQIHCRLQFDNFAALLRVGPKEQRDYVNHTEVLMDPTGASNEPVVRVSYPAGHWRSQPGGTLFYAFPYNYPTKGHLISYTPISNVSVTLEYEGGCMQGGRHNRVSVRSATCGCPPCCLRGMAHHLYCSHTLAVYFDPHFQWVKGGKLPGIAGGPTGCGGGVNAQSEGCWSVRIMWRRNGDGEAYIYVPEKMVTEGGYQDTSFCANPPVASKTGMGTTVCDWHAGEEHACAHRLPVSRRALLARQPSRSLTHAPVCIPSGVSFARGSWKFTLGKWTKISIR